MLDAGVEVDRPVRDVPQAFVERERVELRRERDASLATSSGLRVEGLHHHAPEAGAAVRREDGDATDVRIAVALVGEEEPRRGGGGSVEAHEHLYYVATLAGAVVERVDFLLDGHLLLLDEDTEADAERFLHLLGAADDLDGRALGR